MLPAIGAASLALDAIQSLVSPQSSSSQANGPGDFGLGNSSSAPSAASGTLPGFGSTQISSDNLNALIDAQSLASGDLASAFGNSASDPSQGPTQTSGAASSTYNSINQLAQTTAIPVGLSVSA